MDNQTTVFVPRACLSDITIFIRTTCGHIIEYCKICILETHSPRKYSFSLLLFLNVMLLWSPAICSSE